ncbi:hypothetical protein EG028_04640 [Chitinophaga barathri]|uniref:Fibronectin type-III domain-containing protein n=2 Tax=Chitinophaga barathri TaxID=1647451 RepID=A0A3N4MKK7_9BACT|nr:hypothetical protein EG028_04640 [Chitinophaga barathri]
MMANMQLNPPYSLYLSDYSAPDLQRMQVHLLLKDLTESNYKIRLRFRIEGLGVTLLSKNNFYVPPIVVNGGEMIMISGSDLAPYLNPQNLQIQGLDLNKFTRDGGKLPEGIYRFTVEALDYTRNNVVSNAGTAIISTFLSYPPVINMPLADQKVEAMEPQNVVFQWMPRHTSSFNSAFSVAYKFKLVELVPANRDPNDALRTTRPLFETITDQTLLVYGAGEPMLTPGNNYVVQVQAVEAEGKDMFVNNGFSEAVRFTYGEKCSVPFDVVAAFAGRNSLKLTWSGTPKQQGFTVRYREEGGSAWYEETAFVPQASITGLKPGKTYEYQVKGQCIWGYGDYSIMQSFKMPDEQVQKGDFVCGKPVDLSVINNRQNLEKLQEGDTITAGDFKVVISRVAGAGGSFSGEGEVLVPFLEFASLTVTFSNIYVNTDKKMYEGIIQIKQDDPGKVSATLNKTLTELLDNINNSLLDQDLTSLQNMDLAGILDAVKKMRDWPDLSPAVKEQLAELETKITEAKQLLDNKNLTPEEKAALGEKIAKDVKDITQKIKNDLKEMAAIAKELLGIYKKSVSKLRKDFPDDKLNDQENKTNRALNEYNSALDAMLAAIISEMGGSPGGSGTGTVSKPVLITSETSAPAPETEEIRLARQYLHEEYLLNKARLVQLLDKEKDNASVQSVVINAIRIQNETFQQYYNSQKAQNKGDDSMVDDVAAAIAALIEKTLKENIYKKP